MNTQQIFAFQAPQQACTLICQPTVAAPTAAEQPKQQPIKSRPQVILNAFCPREHTTQQQEQEEADSDDDEAGVVGAAGAVGGGGGAGAAAGGDDRAVASTRADFARFELSHQIETDFSPRIVTLVVRRRLTFLSRFLL